MIASLPMYDRPELRAATDRYWALIRAELAARGLEAPEGLRRGDAVLMPQWEDPDLILSQTCGFPYRARLHGRVELVGTPDFGNAGCPPGYYRSVLIARADDPRADLAGFDGARLAYNDGMSQSGWAAPINHAAAKGIRLLPGPETGSHRASFQAVAEGRADLAAIDALTWALISEFEDVSGVKVVGATDPTPALPYITARGRDAGAIHDAIATAIERLSAADRAALRLRGLVTIPAADYLAVPIPPTPEQIGKAN
ncbi:phosphate/phosphite/phosphonate ABC transporter substrate-binding protein [Rhodobacter sp. HX-7-19]|uniref:Phosphate/phosphite/phosphonate ABC transporter substrate-binding protein n=1 Tax=Paragemmobacter kunshanensis TaxID=2583234 RepID=A0A6M1TIV1_9RHOB|nr:PhnD/SsuA/transferrin family substrate-binding protein [Rhodobacter kunshanensis]NGQ89799.1 phosphate/phosphite/phosphonate ABC transporter substrate-binding protein [Rhodobacter kunshanensis]